MQRQIEIKVTAPVADQRDIHAKISALAGVVDYALGATSITLSYNLRETGAAPLLDALQRELPAFAPRGLERWRLTLRCYRDSILRDDFANEMGWDSFVREIYASRYRHRRHGRRDDRPRHWRQYAAKNTEK